MRHPTEISSSLDGYCLNRDLDEQHCLERLLRWSADEKMVLFMQAPNIFRMLPRHTLSSEQAEDLMGHLEKCEPQRVGVVRHSVG